MLSEETVNDIKKLISQYPYPRAAMLPALSLAQKEKGYIGDDVMVELANILNVPISSVKSVVYFYDLYRHRPG
ncbi:MAG: NADH-quinone oxidoreductase subunit NuoE, partial [Nitrospirae bacterium]